ncbi:hypothetical protein [Streptomyces sp. NPDC059003]|uniref:hypothetical protein n=1 Tax=Streptomyces sp. NPDC059003 TaxID=3346691 RepID=UPI0036C88646
MNTADLTPADPCVGEAARSDQLEIRQLLDQVAQYAKRLDKSPDQLLSLQRVSHATGIPRSRVRELVQGACPLTPPPHGEELKAYNNTLFVQRFKFLRETRHDESGEPYSLRGIARGTGISAQQVGHLLVGERGPNNDHATRIERFFRVPEGFCSRPEGAALITFLRPLVGEELPNMVTRGLLQELDIQAVGLRRTGSSDGTLNFAEILPALEELARRQRERSKPQG